MDDSSHAQIKSEIDRIKNNIDAILKKVESSDEGLLNSTDPGKNMPK
jgi:flagellin-like hook-associated protein FlgL